MGTSRLQRPRRLQLITAQLCVWIFEPRQDWQLSHFPGSFGATIYDKLRCRLQWLSRPCVQYNENRDVKDLKYAIGFSICNIVFVLPWPHLQKKNACSIEVHTLFGATKDMGPSALKIVSKLLCIVFLACGRHSVSVDRIWSKIDWRRWTSL